MQILTANRLVDGDVVFLTSDDDWSIDINEACVADDTAQAAILEDKGAKADADAHVIGCYLVDVKRVDGKIEATHYREIMRTKGPTVRSDLGKQAQIYGSGGLRSGKSIPEKFIAENDTSIDLIHFAAVEQEKFHVSV